MKKKRNMSLDERFWQLLTLADDGDKCAQADLGHEYEFIYGVDKAPITNDRLIQAVFTATVDAKAQALKILEDRGDAQSCSLSNEPLLLTMGQACELIPCSRATLWRIVKAGRLEKVELYPNAYRLRRSDVVALANGKAVHNV